MSSMRELLGLEVVGKCICGSELIKWEHESATIIECSNCMLRIVKIKEYPVIFKTADRLLDGKGDA